MQIGDTIKTTTWTVDGRLIMARIYKISKRPQEDPQYLIILPCTSSIILQDNYKEKFDWIWWNCCVHRPGVIKDITINESCEEYRKALVKFRSEKCYICGEGRYAGENWPCSNCTASSPIKTFIGRLTRKKNETLNKHGARCRAPKYPSRVGFPKSRSRPIQIRSMDMKDWVITTDLNYRKFCAEPVIIKMLYLLKQKQKNGKFIRECPRRIFMHINSYLRRYY